MEEEQVLKEFELTNCIVGGSYSLLTFKAGDANANVGRCDHIHIISSITDRKCCFVRVTSTHHPDDFSLLFGANATGENDIGTFAQVNKFFD